MPAGYLQPDDGTLGVRSEWSAPVATDTATWLTTSVLKYTQQEIMARGWTAEGIKDQV